MSLDLAIRGRHVGYLPGAGDDVAARLEQMGYAVTSLTGADLTPDTLRGLDAVVIGIRAFNVRTDLAGASAGAVRVCRGGRHGHRAVQHAPTACARAGSRRSSLRLSRDRVTDEHAPVTILAPEHPVLTTPNRITAADFEGWVQERGLYFPDQWDERFTAILASGDPGETPLKGGLLVARHGKGYFVYTSLAWFRQLPEGSARRVSAVRESRLAGQVTPTAAPDERSEAEPPDVPGFRTWRGVYLFVFGWFVLVVVLLAVFTGSSRERRRLGRAARHHGGHRRLRLLAHAPRPEPQHVPAGQPVHRLGHDRPVA